MYILILVTTKDKREARKIARALINSRLAACVNILNKVESVFRWQGKVDSASEAMLFIKSKRTKLPQVIRLIKSLHSYDLPEIISFSIASGSKEYLNWIDESLR